MKNEIDTDYQGWKNRATWNVALWIGNDEPLYQLACDCARRYPRRPYRAFLDCIGKDSRTPDGFKYGGAKLDYKALNEMMREFIN